MFGAEIKYVLCPASLIPGQATELSVWIGEKQSDWVDYATNKGIRIDEIRTGVIIPFNVNDMNYTAEVVRAQIARELQPSSVADNEETSTTTSVNSKPLKFLVGVVEGLQKERSISSTLANEWARFYDAEYFEILEHGGTGSLDFDPVMMSIAHHIYGSKRQPKCCPPDPKLVKKRAHYLYQLRGLVWLAILLNNGAEIYALFLLLQMAVPDANPGIIVGFMLFSTAVVIGF